MSDTTSTPGTPGSQAVANLQNRQRTIAEFKRPTSAVVGKRIKPKILTEEKYIEEMSKIIQRDFFPDLDKLRAQNEYLDALERKDYGLMQAIRAKYSGRVHTERSRSATPATFETPNSLLGDMPAGAQASDTPHSTVSSANTVSSASGDKCLSASHSLDSFLHKYTSEDNYSFQEIIDTADEKLRQKFAVLFDEEQNSMLQLTNALTLPAIEQQFDAPDPMRKIETWTYKNMNSIMYIPDGVQLTEDERIEAARRKQSVQHSATRLAVDPFKQNDNGTLAEGNSQPKVMPDKVGADGNVITASSGVAGAAVPQIRGFDLLKTPSPRPGEAFSPLMTWGEIEGTPFRLDGSDTPLHSNAGPAFKINENSRRENIALALAERVGEKMRAQKQRNMNAARKNIGSPFMRSNIERLASMSPAARRLASSKLGLRSPSLTPTPRSPNFKVGSKASTTAHKQSPAVALVKSNQSSRHNTETETLTDNLLKIPTKRLKAADFF